MLPTPFQESTIATSDRMHADKIPTVVEINLRLPSMVHGKKGFERIVWAFKNVLNQSVAWLFFDLASGSDGIAEGTGLLPTILTSFH